MPVIHIEMWPGRTHSQKKELAKAITDAMVNITKTTPEATIIIFDDIPKESWAQAGVLASET
jgi:4-oxalocrotonate tautomerase